MIQFDEASHIYRVDGEPVPSVTQIITAVCGNGLENVPESVLERASIRGTCVHKATEIFDNPTAFSETWQEYVGRCGDDVAPYVQAYVDAGKQEYSHIEHMIYVGGEFPYCGTIDRATKSEVKDLKTSSVKMEDKWSLQLTPYALAMNLDTITALWLSKDKKGKVTQKEVPLTMRTQDWQACLRVFYLVHYKNWKSKVEQESII